MKGFHKIVSVGLIGLPLIFGGCPMRIPTREWSTLEGTVKEEFGAASRLIKSSGALFGNESVKIGDLTYGLVLESVGKTYTIRVTNLDSKPVIALAKAIEPGDRVRITYRDFCTPIHERTTIDKNGIGTTPSTTIDIIEKGNQ